MTARRASSFGDVHVAEALPSEEFARDLEERGLPASDSVAPGVVLRFARTIARPGGKALLIAADNAGEGWVSIEEAAASGRAFAVDVAAYVFAVDADTAERGAAAENLIPLIISDGLQPVLIASGRPGHRHLLTLIPDAKLLARWTSRAKAMGLDVRRTIRPPLSPHRHGLRVELLYPYSVDAALAALTTTSRVRRPLSAQMETLLATGAAAGHRSAMIFRLAMAALNAEWTCEEYVRAILEAPAGAKLRARGRVAAVRYLEATWTAAERKMTVRAVTADKESARAFIGQVAAAARAAVWDGRSGPTDYAVLMAHIRLADELARIPYRVDVRTTAERAGIARQTASLAHQRLVHRGWLRLVDCGSAGVASAWTLAIPASIPSVDNLPSGGGDATTVHRRDGEGTAENVHARVDAASADAWRVRGGLGKSAFRVWREVGDEPVSTAALVARLGWRRPRVRRHLSRLEGFGLVAKCADGWRRGPTELEDAARALGVHGAGKAQRYQHEREREDYRIWEAGAWWSEA